MSNAAAVEKANLERARTRRKADIFNFYACVRDQCAINLD